MKKLLVIWFFIITPYSVLFINTAEGVQTYYWRERYAKKLSVRILRERAKVLLFSVTPWDEISHAVGKMSEGEDAKVTLDALRAIITGSDDDSEVREAIYRSGLIYEMLGFYPEALGNYKRLLRHYPDGMAAWKARLRMAYVDLVNNLSSGSGLGGVIVSFYSIYRDSNDPLVWKEALAGYAIALHESGDYAAAEEVFRKIDGYTKWVPTFSLFRAGNYMLTDQYEEAWNLFQLYTGKKDMPDLVSYSLLKLGDLSVLKGKTGMARDYYKRILESVQQRSEMWAAATLAIAELNMERGDLNGAKGLLNDILEYQVSDEFRSATLYYLMDISMRKGRKEEYADYAVDFLKDNITPEMERSVREVLTDTIEELVLLAHTDGNYEKILSLYYDKNEFMSDDTLAIVGDVFHRSGLPAEAVAIYEKIERKDEKIMERLVDAYIMQDDLEEAMAALEHIASDEKYGREGLPMVLRQLGDMNFRRKKYSEALRIYTRVYELSYDPGLYLKLAMTYRFLGKKKEALKVYRALLDKESGGAVEVEAHTGIGDIFYSMGKWKAALSAYKLAVEEGSDLDMTWAFYRLGEINRIMNSKEAAIDAWQKVANKDKGYIGKLARERLKEVDLWELKM